MNIDQQIVDLHLIYFEQLKSKAIEGEVFRNKKYLHVTAGGKRLVEYQGLINGSVSLIPVIQGNGRPSMLHSTVVTYKDSWYLLEIENS